MKKENDWVVALVNNPTFNFSQFKAVGLTPDNTSLLQKDDYRNSQFVQNKFTDPETGNFDDAKFNTFYDNAIKSYNTFAKNDYQDKVVDSFKYDPLDTFKPTSGDIKQVEFSVDRVLNPDRTTTGISRIGVTDKPTMTPSELAQTQKIYNWDSKDFSDETPNDNTLFGNPFKWLKSIQEPIVMAQWDSDGTHTDPFSGKEVDHKKGEYKLNSNGTYYMETLSGRSPYGKQVKSIFDSLTVDNSPGNKYDFMDTDGLDKSIWGTVAKAATTIAPAFIPYVGQVYVAGLLGASLMDTLPTLYNSTIGLMLDDSPFLNTMQGIGRSFQSTNSQYSRENMWSAENFFNLTSDIALQLAEQRLIFNGVVSLMGASEKGLSSALANVSQDAIKTLSKSKKYANFDQKLLKQGIDEVAFNKISPIIQNSQRMAANVSLGYMALISGASSFESALENGASKKEAAMITMGNFAGLYGIMRTGLGEWIFDELTPDVARLQNIAKAYGESTAKAAYGESSSVIGTGSKNWLYNLYDKARSSGSNFWTGLKNHSLNFTQKALAEGIEEVSEEFVTDLNTGLYDAMATFGVAGASTQMPMFQDFANRYLTSFAGGFIGGGMYQLRDISLNGRKPTTSTTDDLLWLIRNNKTKEFKEVVRTMQGKGKMANPNLGVDPVTLEDGTVGYTSTDDISQNDAVANAVIKQVDVLEGFLNDENLNFSDPEIIDKIISRNIKLSHLINNDNYKGNLLNDFGKISSDIIAKKQEIQSLYAGLADTQKPDEDVVNKLTNELNDLRAKRDQILNGDLTQYYVGEAMFPMSYKLFAPYITPTFKSYAEFKEGKDFSEISDERKTQLAQDYDVYKKNQQNKDIRDGYKMFEFYNKKFSPLVANNGELYANYGKVRSEFYDKLVDPKFLTWFNIQLQVGNEVQELRDLNPSLREEFLSTDNFMNFAASTQKFIDDSLAIGGYMDSEARNLLLDILDKANVPSAFKLSKIYSEIIAPLASEFPENGDFFDDSIRESVLNDDPQTIIENINVMFGSDLEVNTENIQDIVALKVMVTKQNLIAQLKDQALKLQTNPIYDMLQELSVNVTGSKLNVFDILKQEETKLRDISTVSDYFITPDRLNELEEAKSMLGILQSVISAAQDFDSSEVIPTLGEGVKIQGYNSLLNANGNQQYGQIRSDLGEMMSQDLLLIQNKIIYLEALANQNIANQVKEHRQTEQVVNKVIVDTLTKDNRFTSLEYAGTKLIDSNLTLSNNSILDASTILNNIYDNYQKILSSNSDKSEKDILKTIFGDLTSKFNNKELVGQVNSMFNSKTTNLTDYDLFGLVLSSMAFKDVDFNFYLKQLLDSGEYKFAPFFNQSYAVKMILAMRANPTIMNFGIEAIDAGNLDTDILGLYNTTFIDGIAGAGKSTAVAKLFKDINNLINKEDKVWKVAPGKIQLENLEKNLGKEGRSFTIEELLAEITGSNDLKNDIDNNSITSNYYKVVKKHSNKYNSDTNVPVIKEDLQYTNNKPNVIFIDEATFLNTIYAQIVSDWASKNNITVVLLGDLNQNGISKQLSDKTIYSNIDPGNILIWRAPKLGISMRITNIQQKSNTDTIVSLLNAIKTTMTSTGPDMVTLRFLISNFRMTYYTGTDFPLNGTRLTTSTSKEEVRSLLSDEEPLGYVYTNVDSPTYKIMQELKNEGAKIDMFKPEEVQGSERKYFVIDTDITIPENPDYDDYDSAINNFYTMFSRSKEGTLFIDNGLSKLFAQDSFIKEDKTAVTPDKTPAIEEFKNFKLENLNIIVGDYNPTIQTKPIVKSEPSKIKTGTSSQNNEILSDLLTGGSTFNSEPGVDNIRTYSFYMRSGLQKTTINGVTYYKKTDSNSDLALFLPSKVVNRPIPETVDFSTAEKSLDISAIKPLVEEFQTKSGIKFTIPSKDVITGNSLTAFVRNLAGNGINTSDDLISKLNDLDQLYSEEDINAAKKCLYTAKSYLAFGRPFDERFANTLVNNGIQDVDLNSYNNGIYKIKVSSFQSDRDYVLDKLNPDLSALEKDKVMISLVYSFGGNEITAGTLARPDTWLENINKMPDSENKTELLKRQSAYNAWWTAELRKVQTDVNYTGYYDVDSSSIEFPRLTRLVNIDDNKELTNFDIENPNIIRSQLYIYSGKGEMERSDGDKILNLSKDLKGKTVIFVCSDPNAVIDGERVNPSNIARLYVRQKELSKSNPDIEKPIRFIVVNPKGLDPINFFDLSKVSFPDHQAKKFLTTIGSVTTSTQIITELWNWRANLIKFREKIAKFKEIEKIQSLSTPELRHKFNEWLKNRPDYAKFDEFQLLESEAVNEDTTPQLAVWQTGNKILNRSGKSTNKYGTLISEDMAEAHITILDSIFQAVGQIVDFSNYSSNYVISTKSALDLMLGKSTGDTITVTSFNDKGDPIDEEIPAFSYNTSYKAIRVISNMYKAIFSFNNTVNKKKNNHIKTKDFNGNDIEINLGEILDGSQNYGEGLYDQIFKILGDTSTGRTKLPSTFENMLKIVLSGYIDKPDNKRTAAPFKYGIFYRGVYSYEDEGASDYEDFYPAGNMENQFTYRTAVELPLVSVSINALSPGTANSVKLDRKSEFNSTVNRITGSLPPNIGTEIQSLIDSANNQYNKEGDVNFNSIMDNLINGVNTTLTERVNDGLKINNVDYITSIEVSKNGDVKIHSILDLLKSSYSDLLPINSDGTIDYDQILNLDRLTGNNSKYLLTLQDGTRINITLDGSEVTADKITTQYIKPVITNVTANELLTATLANTEYISDISTVWPGVTNVLTQLLNGSLDVEKINEENLTTLMNIIMDRENPSPNDEDILNILNILLDNISNATLDCSIND